MVKVQIVRSAALAAIAALIAGAAQAQPSPRDTPWTPLTPMRGMPEPANGAEARYLEAYASLSRRFEAAARENAEAPRRSDPEVANALDTLADVDGRYGGADFPARPGFDVCGVATRVTGAYALYGLEAKLRSRGAMKSDDRAARALLKIRDENLAAYRDEAAPTLAFMPRCWAQVVQAATASMSSETNEWAPRDGKKGRSALMRDVFVASVANPLRLGFTEAQRQMALASAVAAAPTLAGAMTRAERREAAKALAPLRKAAPGWAKPNIDAMNAALEDAACVGFCALNEAPQ